MEIMTFHIQVRQSVKTLAVVLSCNTAMADIPRAIPGVDEQLRILSVEYHAHFEYFVCAEVWRTRPTQQELSRYSSECTGMKARVNANARDEKIEELCARISGRRKTFSFKLIMIE